MKEITILTPNKVGALADIAEALGNNGINIESISAQSFKDMGVIRIITSDEKSAMHVFTKLPATKDGQYEIKIGEVIVVTIPDKPGELAKIARKIAKSGINLECIYQMKKDHEIQYIIKPEKIEEALSALKRNGINVKL